MPLAILKRSVGELPLSFTLDDSMAMTPEFKLSKFPQRGRRRARLEERQCHAAER